MPAWATLIALLVDGSPVVGVASAPALGRRWWASAGGGAWSSAVGVAAPWRISVSGVDDLGDAYLSTTDLGSWVKYHSREAYLALVDACWETRAFGDFWQHCLVAEGAMDVAAEAVVNPWDVAALQVIVTEAGGRFSDLAGRPRHDGGSALSTNGRLYRQVRMCMRRAVLQQFWPESAHARIRPVLYVGRASAHGLHAPRGRFPGVHFIPAHQETLCPSPTTSSPTTPYAETFSGPLPLPPAKHVAVVACMDARLDVYRAPRPRRGRGARDPQRRRRRHRRRDPLAGDQPAAARHPEIILIHHTDCGMLTFTDDAFKAAIQDETGIKPPWSAESFTDLDEDVRQSIARIKASPFVPHTDPIRGFVFDVATGMLDEVV